MKIHQYTHRAKRCFKETFALLDPSYCLQSITMGKDVLFPPLKPFWESHSLQRSAICELRHQRLSTLFGIIMNNNEEQQEDAPFPIPKTLS